MPAASASYPAAKAIAMDFEVLPVVNSKKQYIGVVFRKDLEALVYGAPSLKYFEPEKVTGKGLTPGQLAFDDLTDQRFVPPEEEEIYGKLGTLNRQKAIGEWLPSEEMENQEALERTLLLRRIGLVVYSKSMMELIDLALRVARVDSTVLISGESGVGKELLAKLIHDQSTRSLGPFVKLNCGAIPENLLESELFGYEPGAFTGASKQGKLGMFELATGGTLFLDEIGELPLSLQVKLLRAIQEQEFVRVGGVKPRKVDIRFIAATNRNLEKMVQSGKFRDDLFYRLNVVPMYVPPLRERKEDILPLVHHFQQKFTQKFKMEKNIAPEVLRALLNYSWLGNVRELENIIERLFVTTPEQLIRVVHVPEQLLKQTPQMENTTDCITLKEAIEQLEMRLISEAVETYGSTYKAAKALGIDQSTLIRKQSKFKIQDHKN